MTYDEALSAIHSRKTFSSAPSLQRMARLMEALGNPQDSIRTVHVAGTNGKGSVCAMVESALRAAGYRTGLFTSPYLVDFRERIQINRRLISEAMLVDCYRKVTEQEERLWSEGSEPLNEFELVTAMGFLAFAMEQVDYAVIEVGLGGRYDATNVISGPEVCCITSISLDHTAVLGDTVAQIAAEKGGIIKPGCPVVLAAQEPEAEAVLRGIAAGRVAPLVYTEPWEVCGMDVHGLRLRLGNDDLRLPLLGAYQAQNASAAWQVCITLGLAPDAIRRGFSSVEWPGRLQYVAGNPPLLIDAGHNPAGIKALGIALDSLFPDKSVIAVMAMMRDKDHALCVPAIAGRSRLLIAATVGLPRSLPPEELAGEASAWCRTLTAQSVTAGIALARSLAEPDDLIVVCGSVYAAGEAQNSI